MNIVYKNKRELIADLVKRDQTVLDVGFWGQGNTLNNKNWVHKILKENALDVYGIDLDFDVSVMTPVDHYFKASAESFNINKKFDVIFASDLIEHLPNPGLFLNSVGEHLNEGGYLIITTPNTFNIFNIAEKFMKNEPTVNSDHTCYFNNKTLKQLLNKVGWDIKSTDYIYSLELTHHESLNKKILNVIYYFFSLFTPKYIETLSIVAVKK